MALVFGLVPIGPWVDDGAAPCDPAGQYCFPRALDAAVGCTAEFNGPYFHTTVNCVIRATEEGGSPGAVALPVHTHAPRARLDADVQVDVTVVRTAPGPANGSATLSVLFDANITGAEWRSGQWANVSLGPTEEGPRTSRVTVHTLARPHVDFVVLPFVYDGSGGVHGFSGIGFNLDPPATPGPGVGLLLVGVLVAGAWAGWRRTSRDRPRP